MCDKIAHLIASKLLGIIIISLSGRYLLDILFQLIFDMRTTPQKALTRTYLYHRFTNNATSLTYLCATCQQQLSLSERDRHAKPPKSTFKLFFFAFSGAFCSHTHAPWDLCSFFLLDLHLKIRFRIINIKISAAVVSITC